MIPSSVRDSNSPEERESPIQPIVRKIPQKPPFVTELSSGFAAVIVAGDGPVAEDTLHKANLNDVVVAATEAPAFEVIGKLYELGVGKKD